MDQEKAQRKREEYNKPQNVCKRKIAGRYEWAWNCIGIQILISQILSVLIMIPVMIISVINARNGEAYAVNPIDLNNIIEYSIPISAVCYIIANTLAAFIALKVTKAARFRDYLHMPNINPGLIILAVFATLGISNLDSIIMNLFSSVFSASNEQLTDSISGGLLSDNIILVILSVSYIAVIGPFLEELLCRGAILSLSGHISPEFGIFASAFIFGIFHLNISQFFNAFLLGLLLGYITYKSKSIIPSTIMHIANNSCAVIEVYLADKLSESAFERFEMIFCIGSIIIGIAALVAIIVYFRKHKDEENTGSIIVNKPVTDEEVAELGLTEKQLTVKMFFTRWSFFLVFAFFIFSCLAINMMF